MSRLHEKCKTDTPAKLYKSEITSVPSGEYVPILQPRNLRQAQNVRCKQQQKKRISHDGLYNLHQIAIDISENIHEIHTFSDLVCVLGQKAMLDEMDRVLLLNPSSSQLLSYDTFYAFDTPFTKSCL